MYDANRATPVSANGIPRHVGFIPDGNRRRAAGRGLSSEAGYAFGIGPGYALYERCRELGVAEVSVYADIYVVEEYWPDFTSEHLDRALAWYRRQERTLGG